MYTESPLGKETNYRISYDPRQLFPISRKPKRDEIGVVGKLPFEGLDVWNAFEVSWLNNKGKPEVAIAELLIPIDSEFLVESKSIKLYFNSFNQCQFDSLAEVQAIMTRDMSASATKPVTVKLLPHKQWNFGIAQPQGFCVDDLDIACDCYETDPALLQTVAGHSKEWLYSELLKSNCLVTDQPDWGTVQIYYEGPTIDRESLLRYIVSFRMHNEFHEQCVERIFMDLTKMCKPEKLLVFARYTRRGGLDINPYRWTPNMEYTITNDRFARQ